MIKAVLFDLDDTLFDHRFSCRNGLQVLMNRFNCFKIYSLNDFELEHYKLLNEIHLNQVLTGNISIMEARKERFKRAFNKVGYNFIENECDEAVLIYKMNYESKFRCIPGSIELLSKLQNRVKLGIISNNLVSEQERKMKNIGIENYFDVIVCSEEAGVVKPDSQIFKLALSKLKCKPEDTIMIGDSWEVDIMGAYNSGIKSIWLNRTNQKIPANNIALEIKSFLPVEDVINKIFN